MIDITDILRVELERFASALESHDIALIIGGGYGLLLRQEHVQRSGVRTVRAMPTARSTNDLDIFLAVEIVADADKMQALRETLQTFGYESVAGAEHYQFRKAVTYRTAQRDIKVDLLAPPPQDPVMQQKVRVDARRIRNRATPGIHAHTTPEAFTVAESAMVLPLGQHTSSLVLIPHPYSFLLLKLYAYRDRRNDASKELGRYHAFDLYRIIAMMTEDEYESAELFRNRFDSEEIIKEARRIVAELFNDVDSRGALAVREHARSVGMDLLDQDFQGFLEDLRTFFPRPA